MPIARRDLFQHAALASSLFGVPLARASRAFEIVPPPLPTDDLHAKDPERYWPTLRRQWLLAPERINLNCGSVGATPLPVLRAVVEHMLDAEAFREPGNPTFGYEETPPIRQAREALARFMGCDVD